MYKSEKIRRERRLHDSIKSLDTGEGIYVVTGSPDKNGEIKPNFYFSNNFPDLEIETLAGKRKLEVSFSSNVKDNTELLHQLFVKTRNRR